GGAICPRVGRGRHGALPGLVDARRGGARRACHRRVAFAGETRAAAGTLAQAQGRAVMRILLAQNSLYYPAHGGGDKSNRLLLEAALAQQVARVVYLARATLALPFGPDCAFPNEANTERIRACDAAVGVSEYVAAYMRKYGRVDAVHVPISLMDPEEWPELGQ